MCKTERIDALQTTQSRPMNRFVQARFIHCFWLQLTIAGTLGHHALAVTVCSIFLINIWPAILKIWTFTSKCAYVLIFHS